MVPPSAAGVKDQRNDRPEGPLAFRYLVPLPAPALGIPQLHHVEQDAKGHRPNRRGLVFHQDEEGCLGLRGLSERGNEDQIGQLLAQLFGEGLGGKGLQVVEVDLVGGLAQEHADYVIQMRRVAQEPLGAPVGKLPDGKREG